MLAASLRTYLFFLFTTFAVGLVTNVSKTTLGRLRPNFLDVCRPNYAEINCTTTDDYLTYVTGTYYGTLAQGNILVAAPRVLLGSAVQLPRLHQTVSSNQSYLGSQGRYFPLLQITNVPATPSSETRPRWRAR